MNHFIEVGTLEDGSYAFTIHTGSRGLGFKTARYHQSVAENYMRSLNNPYDKPAEIKKLKILHDNGEITGEELGKRIKDLGASHTVIDVLPDLAYLEGELLNQYLYDMYMCQMYADQNRYAISVWVESAMDCYYEPLARSIHNFIDPDDMILRKGAIKATEGEIVAIPINRTEGTWICRVTKSAEEYNYSLPHGAGRTQSRTASKKVTSQDMADKMMEDAGIYSSNNPRDEADNSYKSSESIWESISDRVDRVDVVAPVLNIK